MRAGGYWLAMLLALAASVAIAGRYAPKALFFTWLVFAMNDTGEPLWKVLLLQARFLAPLALLAGGAAAAIAGLRRPTARLGGLAVVLPAFALGVAVFLSGAW
ncbi:MAG TPA: hypothetical protein VG939_04190 [Caulobacteraceae bacterium]|nr:hypothetical protein [Caulobacteraceae bacterium]